MVDIILLSFACVAGIGILFAFVWFFLQKKAKRKVKEEPGVVSKPKTSKEKKEPKTRKPKKITKTPKIINRLVCHYSNIGVPFLEVLVYKDGLLTSKYKIDFESYQLENGCIINLEAVAEELKEHIELYDIDLVLSIQEGFKSVNSIPKMPKYKALALVYKELKESFPKYKEDYLTIQMNYKHSLGYAFYTYFIPEYIVESFKKLAKLLNVNVLSVDIFGSWLFEMIRQFDACSFSAIYVQNSCCTILNSYDSHLISTYDVEVKGVEDIVRQFSLIVGKHELELERKAVSKLYLDGDSSVEIPRSLDAIEQVEGIQLDIYTASGKKI